MRSIAFLLLMLLAATSATSISSSAQETPAAEEGSDIPDLTVDNPLIVTRTDAFGQPVTLVEGDLVNNGVVAYTNINIFGDVLDADGNVIGEAFGFPVNACGTGLLDFALQPQQRQGFSAVIELFDEGEIDTVELFPQGTEVEPEPLNFGQTFPGVRGVRRAEVVSVEWIDANTLRYGIGCDADMFLRYDWFEYNLDTGTGTAVGHPAAERVTGALLEQIGLTDPTLLNRSFLTFAPTSRRIIYQTNINTVITAEPDGSFKRLIWDDLARRSLHGFIWLPQGRFLAYYYGAYGEEVTYFTASVEGQRISGSIYDAVTSRIIPGPTPDGSRVVIATTINDVTGYFLQQTGFAGVELLFETEDIPGNNYPAPVYAVNAANEAFIYIVRDVDETPMLQCFNRQTGELNDLTNLPLNLTTDDRAWSYLSPDGSTLAVAANGVMGGLWLLDLAELGGCAGS